MVFWLDVAERYWEQWALDTRKSLEKSALKVPSSNTKSVSASSNVFKLLFFPGCQEGRGHGVRQRMTHNGRASGADSASGQREENPTRKVRPDSRSRSRSGPTLPAVQLFTENLWSSNSWSGTLGSGSLQFQSSKMPFNKTKCKVVITLSVVHWIDELAGVKHVLNFLDTLTSQATFSKFRKDTPDLDSIQTSSSALKFQLSVKSHLSPNRSYTHRTSVPPVSISTTFCPCLILETSELSLRMELISRSCGAPCYPLSSEHMAASRATPLTASAPRRHRPELRFVGKRRME